MHQGSALSPLLFVMVMEALSRDFRVALPWELLYADDLIVIGETVEDLIKRLNKVMISGKWQKVTQKARRWPCAICGKGVGNSSIQCRYEKWVHRKCSGIKGSMYKVMKTFICRHCMIQVTDTGCTSVDIGVNANLELVDKFC